MAIQRIYGFHRNDGMLHSSISKAPKGQKNSKLPPIGEVLEHSGEIVMCQSGLHMSDTIIGAIVRGAGKYLDYGVLEGDIQQMQDNVGIQYVGRTRKIYRRACITPIMKRFTRTVIEEILPVACADETVRLYAAHGSRKLKAAAIAQNRFELASHGRRKTEYDNNAVWHASYAIQQFFKDRPLVYAQHILSNAVQCKAHIITSAMSSCSEAQYNEIIRGLWRIYDQRFKKYIEDIL